MTRTGASFGSKLQALRQHFEDGCRHEEAGAERYEVAEIFLDAFGL